MVVNASSGRTRKGACYQGVLVGGGNLSACNLAGVLYWQVDQRQFRRLGRISETSETLRRVLV